MTLLATVLISIVAATIAVGVVYTTVVATRSEASRTDFGRATSQVAKVRAEFERQLAADPQFFYKRMFSYERPRRCLISNTSDPSLVTLLNTPWLLPYADPNVPGPLWPSDICGTVWGYPETERIIDPVQVSLPPIVVAGVSTSRTWNADQTSTWEAKNFPVRAEVSPDRAGGGVTLTILAAVGSAEAGETITYGRSTVANWSMYSGSDLNLSEVMHPIPGVPLQNASFGNGSSVYSAGVIRLPTSGVDLNRTRLAAEGGFVGTAGDDGAKLLTGQVGVSGPFGDQRTQKNVGTLRSVVPVPLTSTSLRASAGQLDDVGCPDGNVPPANMEDVYRSTYLCLAPGRSVRTIDDVAVTVPATAGAWLIVPAGEDSSSASVKLYYASEVPTAAKQCVFVGCSATAVDARASVGSHVQSPLPSSTATKSSSWTFLAQVRYPSTGVIATSGDAVVGRCVGFASGRCVSDSAAGEPSTGWTFRVPVTVWAGSQSAPADLWVAGEIRSTEPVGLVSSGRIILPSFAAPTGLDLKIRAQVVALGFGNSTTEPVTGWPTGSAAPVLVVNLVGTLAAPSLTQIGTVASLSVAPVAVTGAAPDAAPLLPGFSQAPVVLSSQQVAPGQVCGKAMRAAGVDSVSSCVGLW